MARTPTIITKDQPRLKIPARAKGAGMDPSEVIGEVADMRRRADLAKALMGGTEAMRAKGQTYLPKMKHEDDDTYKGRMALTVLRNFYRHSLSALAGKLVRNGVRIDVAASSKAPKEMEDWLLDLDHCGTPSDVLFKRSFIWSVRDAAMWLLATYPETGGNQTLADEREKNIRPWLIPLSVWDTLGWRKEVVGGRSITTQFRYEMVEQVPAGLFGTEEQHTVRVIEPTTVQDFRKNRKGDWELVKESINTLGRVPSHRIASDMDENQMPRGGMADLAWLNMEHWQLRSDQRLTMRINSFPILFGAGMQSLPPIGPDGAVLAEDSQATLQFVESGGTNLGAGRQELVDVEDAMRAMSAQYQTKGVQKTATESTYDAEEANAPAQGWAINAKRGFEAAMDDMAELAGKGRGPGAGGKLRVDTDALVSSMGLDQLNVLWQARQAREISRATFLSALQRANLLPDDFSAEDDQELIDDEPVQELEGMNTPPGKGSGGKTKP